jgi:hypothetical protein
MLQAVSKVMDGKARFRAEDWRSPFSVGCRAGDLLFFPPSFIYACPLERSFQRRVPVRSLVTEAREEDHAKDAPYGDDDRGLCRWLLGASISRQRDRMTRGDRASICACGAEYAAIDSTCAVASSLSLIVLLYQHYRE